jgi:aminoglycoside phosphotransferase (APT) family kinase protein
MPSIDRQQAFSGIKDAVPALRLDIARLESYLAAQVEGFAGPLTIKQFKGGQSNPTYLMETPARRYVLRRKPPGKLLPSAHAVDREYRVIQALHAQNLPVAEPLAYCRRERRWYGVLRHGFCRRACVLGAANAGLWSRRAHSRLRLDV